VGGKHVAGVSDVDPKYPLSFVRIARDHRLDDQLVFSACLPSAAGS
jgi:hypothetical protein